jgi:viroplasmin and RNaseH domain-containing protein
LLEHEDSIGGLSNTYKAYGSLEVAEAWMGKMIQEILKKRWIKGYESEKVETIKVLLAEGNFNAARSIFNTLQMGRVWVAAVDLVVAPPMEDESLDLWL